MNKKISLIMAIIFLCNFILPMICNRSYAETLSIDGEGESFVIPGSELSRTSVDTIPGYIQIEFDQESGI